MTQIRDKRTLSAGPNTVILELSGEYRLYVFGLNGENGIDAYGFRCVCIAVSGEAC